MESAGAAALAGDDGWGFAHVHVGAADIAFGADGTIYRIVATVGLVPRCPAVCASGDAWGGPWVCAWIGDHPGPHIAAAAGQPLRIVAEVTDEELVAGCAQPGCG